MDIPNRRQQYTSFPPIPEDDTPAVESLRQNSGLTRSNAVRRPNSSGQAQALSNTSKGKDAFSTRLSRGITDTKSAKVTQDNGGDQDQDAATDTPMVKRSKFHEHLSVTSVHGLTSAQREALYGKKDPKARFKAIVSKISSFR